MFAEKKQIKKTSGNLALDLSRVKSDGSNEQFYNANWSLKRIGAAILTGGASEAVAAVTNRDAETGERKDNPGGNKWTEKEANKFFEKAAGKVDKVRAVTKSIIGTEPNNVKPNHKKDWEELLKKTNQIQPSIEERWTLLQDYKNKGFGDAKNREEARFNYIKINDMYYWAIKADDQRHVWSTVRDIDKVAQGFKTVNLAPMRAMAIVFIRLNVFNMATIFKMASVRKPEEFSSQIAYKWKQLGGNRTKLNEAINAGYKKKPILSKQMDVKSLGFDGYATDGESASTRENTSSPTVSNTTLNETANTLKAISESIPQKQADTSKKTLEIPSGVIASIPALSTAFGATLGASADRAATAATAGAWGGVVSGLFTAINAMKIPLKANETQPELIVDESTIKNDLLKANKESEFEKTHKIFRFMPDIATYAVGALLLVGGIYYGIKKFGKKK